MVEEPVGASIVIVTRVMQGVALDIEMYWGYIHIACVCVCVSDMCHVAVSLTCALCLCHSRAMCLCLWHVSCVCVQYTYHLYVSLTRVLCPSSLVSYICVFDTCHVSVSFRRATCVAWLVVQSKKTLFFLNRKQFFLNIIKKKKVFNIFFYNLKKSKDISILWSAYSVIHIIYCTIQAVKHYMNCIYIDSGSNNFIIFVSKICLQSNKCIYIYIYMYNSKTISLTVSVTDVGPRYKYNEPTYTPYTW